MDKQFVVTVLVIALVIMGGCMYTIYSDPALLAAIQSTQATQGTHGEEMAQPAPITQADIDAAAPWIGWGLLVLLGLWIVSKIMSSEIAIPIFTLVVLIGIVLFASYWYVYGDKNGDGADDNQIIRVVQPSGYNPGVDAQYSEINKQNTKSNILSMAGISLYIFVLLVAFVVITGVGVVLHTLSANKKMSSGK
jgi:hypothetical protein